MGCGFRVINEGERNVTIAHDYLELFAGRTADLPAHLECAGIELEQDWREGTTTAKFKDGSAIVFDGPIATVTGADNAQE